MSCMFDKYAIIITSICDFVIFMRVVSLTQIAFRMRLSFINRDLSESMGKNVVTPGPHLLLVSTYEDSFMEITYILLLTT